MEENSELIIICTLIISFLIIITVIFFFSNNSATKERLKVLLERQDYLQKNIIDIVEKNVEKIDVKFDRTNNEQNTNIQFIREKIGIIDRAQQNISNLTDNVINLKNLLSNTSKRGRFGEVILENLVKDQLPRANYEFQKTLSNNMRVDCVIKSPNSDTPLCIDSKFPRENYEKIANSRNKQELDFFSKKFKLDIIKHVENVSSKYIIPGETSDIALIFIPSEAIYLEIFSSFPELSNIFQEKKSFLISPTTLWVILSSIEGLLRDKKIKDNTDLIQAHLKLLTNELSRLESRVKKLDSHFSNAQTDLNDILITTKKISNKTQKVLSLDLDNIIKKKK